MHRKTIQERRKRRQRADFIELVLVWQELTSNEQAVFDDDFLMFEKWTEGEARRLVKSVDRHE